MPGQVVAEGDAGAEDREQPQAQLGIVGERGSQPVGPAHVEPGRCQDADQAGQREVGIRGRREGIGQGVDLLGTGERAEGGVREQRLRSPDVGEAQPDQLPGRTGDPAIGHVDDDSRARLRGSGGTGHARTE